MSIEKQIASIPTLTPEQRRIMRGNIMEKMQSPDPVMVENATTLLAELDAYEASLTEERNKEMEEASRKPFAERVVVAFARDPLSASELRVLQVLLDNPGGSCAELSIRIGWAPNTWDMGMGSIVAQRSGWLWGFSAKGQGKSQNLALMTDQERGEQGEIRYTMKPEVVAALAKLGLRPGGRA